jgi:hypothetical protein
MRAKRPLGVLLVLLILGLIQASIVLGTHSPQGEDVVAVAVSDPWLMTCSSSSGHAICDGNLRFPSRHAVITPDVGPLKSVVTDVDATSNSGYYMVPADETWNTALHSVGCNDASGVSAFITTLGADAQHNTPFTLGPTVIGECSIKGSLIQPISTFGAPWYYEVTSTELASAFTPTPTPTPKPTVTPTSTPAPTATPAPTGTATPRATATAHPTATATPTATPVTSESASASVSESPSAAETASATPSPTPEESVLGITFTPEPSVPAGAPDQGVGGWPGSVPSAGQVSTKAADIGGSLLAALLLLVAMGFIGELFNNTMETNYDRIIGWWKGSWVGRIGRGLGGLFGGGSR